LFRKEEAGMRQKLVDADLVECVLGLGPNLFYNSPMEACIVVCRTSKPPERRGKVLFINAVNEMTRERWLLSLFQELAYGRLQTATASSWKERVIPSRPGGGNPARRPAGRLRWWLSSSFRRCRAYFFTTKGTNPQRAGAGEHEGG